MLLPRARYEENTKIRSNQSRITTSEWMVEMRMYVHKELGVSIPGEFMLSSNPSVGISRWLQATNSHRGNLLIFKVLSRLWSISMPVLIRCSAVHFRRCELAERIVLELTQSYCKCLKGAIQRVGPLYQGGIPGWLLRYGRPPLTSLAPYEYSFSPQIFLNHINRYICPLSSIRSSFSNNSTTQWGSGSIFTHTLSPRLSLSPSPNTPLTHHKTRNKTKQPGVSRPWSYHLQNVAEHARQ